jgi:hypothetical protein
MVAANPNNRIPFDESDRRPPIDRVVERVRLYFDRQPELAREDFLVTTRWEFDIRGQWEAEHGPGLARQQGEGTAGSSARRRPLRAEDIHVHAWLAERLAVIGYQRHGLWPRLRQFLSDNRLVRWLRHDIQQPEEWRKQRRSL